MRMYLVYAPHPDEGEAGFAKFVATNAEAATYRKYLNNQERIPRVKITTEEVDVPTKKDELIDFLNLILTSPEAAVLTERLAKK